ncbi:hypothetical protein [Nitrospira lenta]|uniref:Uncharacterized protein n=1 Tax=Nitrospira lenta TaxID=1436998 RepID=A0A330L7W3_9BACT|nr:hypothetical protein [Nitrospira lenta]SPP63026.1 conserved hypothetical protein [Nitrospira lenta]
MANIRLQDLTLVSVMPLVSWVRLFKTICLFLAWGVNMNAYATDTFTWKEEALLPDGKKIIVERLVERGGRHEIGQEPPIKEQRVTFNQPSTSETITWEDKFTEDVGGANFLPMLLGVRENSVYLVVHPMGRVSFMKWGSPNPPYVIFKYQSKKWNRITLHELPMELTRPNLIFSSPDHEAKKAGQSVVSAEVIKRLYDGYRQPEYKSIVRTPVDYGPPRPEHKGPKAPHPITPSMTKDDTK